jgi:hypothetical protein
MSECTHPCHAALTTYIISFSQFAYGVLLLLECRFVKKKFEEVYFQSSKPDRVDRVFKIYRTTALDQKLVKKTFKLIDESMRRSREGTRT